MGENKTTILRKVRRFFVGVLALLLLAAVSLVALHTYYYFTPVQLSDKALLLDRKAADLPRDTDNGLRLVGLLAPSDIDPVMFGQCVLHEERHFWTDHEKDPDRSSSASAEGIQARLLQATKVRNERCARGRLQLKAPDSKALPPLTLHSTAQDWDLWARVKVDPVLWARYEQVMGTAPRYLAPNMYSSGLENFGTLTTLHRIRMGQAIEHWRAGRQGAALDVWESAMRQWGRVAQESLISSMVAVAAMSQTLASMHAAWQVQASSIDTVVWDRIQAITHLADSLPVAIEATVVTEWALTSHAMRHSIASSDGVGGNWLRPRSFLFDLNHTLNLYAEDATARAPFLRSIAEGKTKTWMLERHCSMPKAGPAGGAVCQFVGRNPVGQVLSTVSLTTYESYGTRAADLLNFAAATRLIAEAKKQAVVPAALPSWFEQAPSDHRDLYTDQPFLFDPAGTALRVLLKQRNPILGEPGEYRLPL
jgi:hypothetical protein